MDNVIEKEARIWWNPFHLLHNMYDWVLHWANTPYGVPALFLLAFAESSFFPVPPDVLLIALAISIPTRAFRYALICSIGSVLGGMFGYFLGWQFYAIVGEPIIRFYGYQHHYDTIKALYQQYDAWAVGIAGFTPIPYKVFTIAAGAFDIKFGVFLLASIVSRSARFFLVSGLIWYFGPTIKAFIDKYFNLLVVVFTVGLIGGFVLMKFLW